MIKLNFPFTEAAVRALKVGDEVLISGVVFTGRDAVHKYLYEGGPLPPGVSLRDGILSLRSGDAATSGRTWQCNAAAPRRPFEELHKAGSFAITACGA